VKDKIKLMRSPGDDEVTGVPESTEEATGAAEKPE